MRSSSPQARLALVKLLPLKPVLHSKLALGLFVAHSPSVPSSSGSVLGGIETIKCWDVRGFALENVKQTNPWTLKLQRGRGNVDSRTEAMVQRMGTDGNT